MSLIELELIEELFTPAQKQELVGKLNDAIFALKYEYRHWLGPKNRESAENADAIRGS